MDFTALEQEEVEVIGHSAEQAAAREYLDVVGCLEVPRDTAVHEPLQVGVEPHRQRYVAQQLEHPVARVDRVARLFIGGKAEAVAGEGLTEIG
jgi:hypothetical protein